MSTQNKRKWNALRGVYVLLAGLLAVLVFRCPAASALLLLFVCKEILSEGLRLFEKKRKHGAAAVPLYEWLCVPVLAAAVLCGFISGGDSYLYANLLCCAGGAVLLISLVMQGWDCLIAEGKLRPRARRIKLRYIVIPAALYLLLGAALPFVYQPTVQESTEAAFDASQFYSDEVSGERAAVISDNGEALEKRIALISQANDRIILSTFEFRSDTSGKQMIAALMDAAARGVQVSILMDGVPYISSVWGNPYFLALAQTENVEIRLYNPIQLWKPWAFMGRMHDKYLIVDDTGYILGGRNTYDYFLGAQDSRKNYDWDILVYSGDAGADSSLTQVEAYFSSVWELEVCQTMGESSFWARNPSVQNAREELNALYQTMQEEHASWFETADDTEDTTVAVNHIALVSNPSHIYAKEPTVFYTITELMKQAEQTVTFHTPYIICNDWMLEQLADVCAQVDAVTMLTNSVANNGNGFGAMDYQKYKGDILATGVQILEYDKGISYHGKCFVVDDRLASIGSFNWDMRSVYIDTETILVVDGEAFNQQLRAEMQAYEADAFAVIDEKTYDLPDGETLQTVSLSKKGFILFLNVVIPWARFLM